MVEAKLNGVGRTMALMEWLTVERAAYAGLTLLAVLIRLVGLGWQPLNPAEATQALPAVAAAAGQPYDVAGISPLLFSLQRLLFTPLGADEILARFWPALLGGLAALLFYALRDRLTRGGALAAAFLWAVSPLAVFTGRLGVGASLTPPLALALLACLNGYFQAESAGEPTWRSATWLTLAAAALGGLLASGSSAYTVLLIGLAAAIWRRGEFALLWPGVRTSWRGMLAAGLGALAFGATSFFLTPAGLAAAADLAGSWLTGLAPFASDAPNGAWGMIRRLLISEPLLLALGVAGLVSAAVRRDRFGRFAGLAAAIALLAALVSRDHNPLDLNLVVLALALLAGPALAAALRGALTWRDQLDPWLLTALELILLATAAHCLLGAVNTTNKPDWLQLYTSVGIVTFVLAVLLWLIYGVFGSWRTVVEALPIVLIAVGGVWGASQLNALSFERGAGRQSAMLSVTPDAGGLTDLRRELDELLALKGGGALEARVDLVLPLAQARSLAPLLGWELRHLRHLRVANTLPTDPAPIVITVADKTAVPGETYGGADFSVLQRWGLESLSGFAPWVRWLAYREALTPAQKQQVVLWVDRADPTKGQK